MIGLVECGEVLRNILVRALRKTHFVVRGKSIGGVRRGFELGGGMKDFICCQ